MFGMGSGQAGFLSKVIEGETYVFSMYIDITNLGDNHSIYFSGINRVSSNNYFDIIYSFKIVITDFRF